MPAFFFKESGKGDGRAAAALAGELNKIARALNRIRIDGNEAIVSDDGIELFSSAAGIVRRPWDWLTYVPATRVLTLRAGYVEVHSDTGVTYIAHSGGGNPTVTLAANTTNFIFLTCDPWLSSPSYTLATQEALDTTQSTAATYRKLLWFVDHSDDGVSGAIRYCSSNPEPPIWRPV